MNDEPVGRSSARRSSLQYDPGTTAGPRACAGVGTRRHKPDAFFLSQLTHNNLSYPLFRNPDHIPEHARL